MLSGIGTLKTVKILTERYRNKDKKLSLKFYLITETYNLELLKSDL